VLGAPPPGFMLEEEEKVEEHEEEMGDGVYDASESRGGGGANSMKCP